MDVLKVFVEEPATLRSEAAGTEPATLDALLGRRASGYGRLYLAGTHLAADRPRVGLTALADARVFVEPLLAWAGERAWQHLDRAGLLAPLADPASVLACPDETAALVLGSADGNALATVAAGDRADALRALLDGGASVLLPEPAHDGWDWSVFGPSPLGVDAALRAHAASPNVQRFIAPLRLARGEHAFYFEQWALDPPPAWAERL